MAQARDRVVQGCFVSSFTVKKDTIKVSLKAIKDDVRAGDGDIGDVLKSLELHSTAGEDAPIKASLLLNELETRTNQYLFVVSSFVVKQDEIKIVLEAEKENLSEGEQADPVASDVVKSLAIHSAGGEDKPVELTLVRADIG